MIGRLIGIDHGRKRIGLAISDAMGVSARELSVLASRGDRADFAAIAEIAEQESAVGLVVGVPHNPNAPAGLPQQADIVLDWIARLRRAVPLPVAEVSEYLTSDEARALAKGAKRNPREPIDDLAARIILQSYLDALSYGSATFPPPA
ncbi:MAG: Holliday junction resolvase RuvX [Chloroflexi bacterium]|nr:Holliday junction resolvase RuvX [Chloroflexota bacterium]